jgi:hypothetical protein
MKTSLIILGAWGVVSCIAALLTARFITVGQRSPDDFDAPTGDSNTSL